MKDRIKLAMMAYVASIEKMIISKQYEELKALIDKWLPSPMALMCKELIAVHQEVPQDQFAVLGKEILRTHLGDEWYYLLVITVFDHATFDKDKVINIWPWAKKPIKEHMGKFGPDLIKYSLTCIINMVKFVGPAPFSLVITDLIQSVKKD
jgi:hypothetical protein